MSGMSRSITVGAIVLAVAVGFGHVAGQSPVQTQARPNIILIQADDLKGLVVVVVHLLLGVDSLLTAEDEDTKVHRRLYLRCITGRADGDAQAAVGGQAERVSRRQSLCPRPWTASRQRRPSARWAAGRRSSCSG